MKSRAWILVCLVSVFLGLIFLKADHEWGDDFAAYLMQAQALATGQISEFVAQNQKTIENSSTLIGPITYPWGTSLILAPLLLIFGFNFWALKLFNLFFFAGFLLLLRQVLLGEALKAPRLSLGIFAFVALNPLLIEFQNQVLSDIPFLFFSTLSLYLITKFVSNRDSSQGFLSLLSVGACVAAALAIRSNGWALIPTLLFAQIFPQSPPRKDFRVWLLPWLSFLIVHLGLGAILPRLESNHMAQFVQSLALNPGIWARELFFNLSLNGEYFEGAANLSLLFWILLPLIFIGFFLALKERHPSTVFVTATLGILVLWQGHQGPRFIFPLLPFFALFLLKGWNWLQTIETFRFKDLVRKTLVLVFVLALANAVGTQVRDLVKWPHRDQILGGPLSSDAQWIFEHIRTQVPPHEAVVFFKPRALRLWTQHPSWTRTDPDWKEARYYLWMQGRDEEQMPEFQVRTLEQKGVLKPLLSRGRFFLYEIQAPGTF